MELDAGVLATGSAILAMCIAPIIILFYRRKISEKQSLALLLNMARQRNARIDIYDIFGAAAIGLDKSKKLLFFYYRPEGSLKETFIDLTLVKDTKVVSTSRAVKLKDSTRKVIEKIELSFRDTSQNKPCTTLEFFNADHSLQLYEELQLAEKWSDMINDHLRK